MMLVRSRVAASPIEGVGVYADEFIPSGTLVWQLNRNFILPFRREELEQFPPHIQEFVEKYSFPDFEDENLLYFELDNGRFMNHSDTPNTDFTAFDKGFAMRDIAVGEEITCNYNEIRVFFPLRAG